MNDSVLVIKLTGKIDSSNATAVGQEIARQRAAKEYQTLIFDAKELTFISSAGLRILMQVIKEEKIRKHALVSMIDVSRDVYDVLHMTGFSEFLAVQKAYREISLEGSELIAEGFFGKVYRLNEDTIVKVYADGEASIPLIKREQARAKKAFVKGLPTAIPYDIVRVGSQYGAVFELLQAKSFNDWAIEYENDRAKMDELMQLYVGCLQQVHDTEVNAGDMPLARDNMLESLQPLQAFLPADVFERLRELLTALPDDLHVVHGDFQMKNVLLCNGEPMLIDMETLCTGQPIFDLQGLYVTYKAFPEDEPANAKAFLGIEKETADYIWQRIMDLYFASQAEALRKEMEEKIRVAASIRFMSILTSTGLKNHPLTEVRIRHTCEHLQELLPRVTSLA